MANARGRSPSIQADAASLDVVVDKVLLVHVAVDRQRLDLRQELVHDGRVVLRHVVFERVDILELDDELVIKVGLADEPRRACAYSWLSPPQLSPRQQGYIKHGKATRVLPPAFAVTWSTIVDCWQRPRRYPEPVMSVDHLQNMTR